MTEGKETQKKKKKEKKKKKKKNIFFWIAYEDDDGDPLGLGGAGGINLPCTSPSV